MFAVLVQVMRLMTQFNNKNNTILLYQSLLLHCKMNGISEICSISMSKIMPCCCRVPQITRDVMESFPFLDRILFPSFYHRIVLLRVIIIFARIVSVRRQRMMHYRSNAHHGRIRIKKTYHTVSSLRHNTIGSPPRLHVSFVRNLVSTFPPLS